MKLKWLSMLLALALVFSLAPAMALAVEQIVTDDTELKDAIADTSVNKIIDLVNVVEEGGTLPDTEKLN